VGDSGPSESPVWPTPGACLAYASLSGLVGLRKHPGEAGEVSRSRYFRFWSPRRKTF
jgi:hypothetical protein